MVLLHWVSGMDNLQEEPVCNLCRARGGASARSLWYEEVFRELYPLIYRHRDEEAAQREVSGLIRIAGLRRGARLLDVCCGQGRHMAALGAAGLDVFGVDLSRPLLERAEERAGIAGRTVRADMRALPFAGGFDSVVNLFTSFGYFEEEEENESALAEMVRVLVPGGVLVMDHMNRRRVERGLVPEDTRTVGGLTLRQQRWIEGDRVLKRIEVSGDEGEPVRLLENVRMFYPEELAQIMERNMLETLRFYGSFQGDEFGESSDRMIAVAQKTGRQV